ncbi:MAG: 6-bladed beta-propeller [Balneolaceae bacterium]|nr:6-bladed beta-propeller [Balneolaceae bacterium]
MKYSKYIKYLAIGLIAISCSNDPDKNEHSFDQFISEVEEIILQDSTRIETSTTNVYSPLDLTMDGEGRMVVVDASNWTLNLMELNGALLDSIGGSGGGPNEFFAINQIHIGRDNRLHVYDGRSGVVSIYSILEGGFEPEREIRLPDYDSRNLNALYETDDGYLGVFKSVQIASGENNDIEVYRLDDDFHLQRHQFDMPGSDTFESNGVRRENPLGASTIWKMKDVQFYYSNSATLSITTVNTQNGSSEEFNLSGYPKPMAGEEEINFLKSVIQGSNVQDPEVLAEGMELPFFINFIPSEDHFYYTLFTANKNYGIILRVDRHSKKMGKILVPPLFNIYEIHENHLVGIDHTDGDNDIVIMSF